MLKNGASSGVKMAFPATVWLLGNKKSLLLAIEKEEFSFLDSKIYARGVILTENR
ncbi:hypothetical protein [Desulfovibrio sp.]|uniref:hypothetical protein n=1 Tax=Desulfovibrio sp. TaxID=885 RepID=UPI002A7F0F6E|nr:hypothetical protein [Desulfovibrio sp.]